MQCSVTIMFLNRRCYSNIANAIYWRYGEQLRKMFIYMTCKFQLVWLMFMRTTIIIVKLVFSSWQLFQIKQKATKFKKTAIINAWNVEVRVRRRRFMKFVWMARSKRARVVIRCWPERPSFNFQTRRIEGNSFTVCCRRPNFERSNVGRNDRNQ
jgi:hypothetical protein